MILLNASSGSSSQNEIKVFLLFLSVLVVLRVKDDYYKINMSHIYIYIYIYISLLGFKSKRILYYYIFKTLLNNNNLNSQNITVQDITVSRI